MGSDILLNILPKFGTGRFLGLMIWQYIGILFFGVIAFLLFFLFRKVWDWLIHAFTRSRFGKEYENPDLIHQMARYLSLLVLVFLFKAFLPVLQLPIKFSKGFHTALDIMMYIFMMLLTLRVLTFSLQFVEKYVGDTDTKMDDQLFLILRRIAQIGIVAFFLISILNCLDINVAALIAGVSVGGLAIALAAQDSVKNLIGAVMIFMDRPFDVGDYIIAGSVQGVVKQVGFRSTRLEGHFYYFGTKRENRGCGN